MSRVYETVSINPRFRTFINDLIMRMGLSEADLKVLFSPVNENNNYKEFAKCFVTKQADQFYNYEVYELLGDACLNNSIITYLFHQINAAQEQKRLHDPTFRPSVQLTDYFNKLKAACISAKELDDIAKRLGFEDFLVKGNLSGDPRNLFTDPDKMYSDSLEAFVGCFEVLADRYLEHHYSHHYVSNFVNYIFNNRKIPYHPDMLYDYITLLKETNDYLRREHNSQYLLKNDSNVTYLHFIVGDPKIYEPHGRDVHGNLVKTLIRSEFVPPASGPIKTNNVEMSRRALVYLRGIATDTIKRDDQSPDKMLPIALAHVKTYPSPESLGIDYLLSK